MILIDILFHADKYIDSIFAGYGAYVALMILFVVIFCETGLVIAPFLPGDSVIFVIGAALSSRPGLVLVSFLALSLAAILGDSVNYWIGNTLGRKILSKIKKEYLDKTNSFYRKYGAKTIVMARFMPIIRTFAPFVAGMGSMDYKKFIVYNIIGGVAWVGLFIFGGYFFGAIPIVRNNLSIVIILILVLSIIPAIIEFLRKR
ncbi:VTT domain-containing protein [Candidatus Pacearchaeota archaeon]|nr:VTT domain-containing protein [Candidatus Pacearchaeota archaeon]